MGSAAHGARNRSRDAGALLLALVFGALSPAARAQELTASLPRDVPAAAAMSGWEKADGRAEVGEWSVVYALYVNPVRPGLYEVTRFRVAHETEKLLWNSRPGSREPLVCYEWSGRRSWRSLWIRRWAWRRLAPGTEAYRAAMFTALRVYALHRARLGLPPTG